MRFVIGVFILACLVYYDAFYNNAHYLYAAQSYLFVAVRYLQSFF